jgi:hypothetical protein
VDLVAQELDQDCIPEVRRIGLKEGTLSGLTLENYGFLEQKKSEVVDEGLLMFGGCDSLRRACEHERPQKPFACRLGPGHEGL